MLEKLLKPLTVKEFDEEVIGRCCGCGCGCGYVLYKKDKKIVDLYGHPNDVRGMGSLCSKGIAYIQETQMNPLRLKGIFLREGNNLSSVDFESAKRLITQSLDKKTAFFLGRNTSLEDYLIASSFGDVFVDAPTVNFRPSTVDFWDWKNYDFILSIDAEPVFSEVMSTRYIVDAVEKSGILVCVSSRFETLCAKAKKRYLLNPTDMINFLESVADANTSNKDTLEIRKLLSFMHHKLVLVGSHLLNSPYRNRLLNLLKKLRKEFKVDYSFVGDLMIFPAKNINDFSPKDYETIIVMGNLFKVLPLDVVKELANKFVIHFTLYPDYTSHNSKLIIGTKNFTEREFLFYRSGFGSIFQSSKVCHGDEFYTLSDFLDVEIDTQEQKYINLPLIESLDFQTPEENIHGVWIHTENTLVEDLGHWYPWLHEMEKYQKAYMNENTAAKLKVKSSVVDIRGVTFNVEVTPKIADNVIFIPKSYDEYQPYHWGVSPNCYMKKPYQSYEVLD